MLNVVAGAGVGFLLAVLWFGPRTRTLANAVRLGSQTGTAAEQSALARTILRDHLACVAAVAVALGLQIAGAR